MFLHSFHPNPVFLDLSFVQIHWYGFLIALSIVIAFLIFYRLAKRAGFNKNFIFNLSFWLIIWGLIGARLYHVLSEIGYYFHHPLEVFFIWQGGVGIFGALMAGILTVFYFSSRVISNNSSYSLNSPFINETEIKRIKQIKTNKSYWLLVTGYWLFLLSLLAPPLALAQAISRWGNYFNQELYGLPTNLPWSIPINLENRLPGYESFEFFHPVFLYESLFCFLIFLILSLLLLKKLKHKESYGHTPGLIFLLYIMLYGTWRFFIEFLRLDPQPVFLSLRLGQWTSLIFIAFSIILYFSWKFKQQKIQKEH